MKHFCCTQKRCVKALVWLFETEAAFLMGHHFHLGKNDRKTIVIHTRVLGRYLITNT